MTKLKHILLTGTACTLILSTALAQANCQSMVAAGQQFVIPNSIIASTDPQNLNACLPQCVNLYSKKGASKIASCRESLMNLKFAVDAYQIKRKLNASNHPGLANPFVTKNTRQPSASVTYQTAAPAPASTTSVVTQTSGNSTYISPVNTNNNTNTVKKTESKIRWF